MNEQSTLLTARIAALEQQLALLEKKLSTTGEPRRLRSLVAVLVILVLVVGLSWWQPTSFAQVQNGQGQQGQGAARDLVCTSLKVVGPDGKELVFLGSDKVSGFVKVNAPDGKMRAALWTDDQSKFGQINLYNDKDKSLIILGGAQQGGYVDIKDPNEKRQAQIGVDEHGGFLDLYGVNSAKRQVIVDCHKDWGGAVTLFTPAETKLIYLGGSSTNGHGLFQLFGKDGQMRLEGQVDNTGVGDVFGINAANQTIRALKNN